MSISTFNAGAITSNKTIPEVSSVVAEFNGLSAKYVARLSADNHNKLLQGGSFVNILANNFGPTGGGFRICNGAKPGDIVNDDSFYTTYQLSCIRHHTNSSTYQTYMFRDEDNNGIVRKSTGASMLSASMFDALKSSIFTAIYPVGSVYTTIDADFNPSTSFGGTWVKTAQGKCLWGANDADAASIIGNDIAQALPAPSLSVYDPGHTHTVTVDANKVTSSGTGAQAGGTVNGYVVSSGSGSCNSKTTGVSVSVKNSGAYSSSNTVVQPPAVRVIFWKRTA